jgi:PucR family transcriptional regulator, purine catabolism regulatory protein
MVSVQVLLDLGELGLVARHVPDPDLDVRWVATSELTDPSPYLEGGEVLLTTGLETAHWRREWAPYVRRLAARGVTAIGLAVGLTHETTPEPLLAACRRHGVALFEVPRATTFVSISRAAARLLQAVEESATQRALELQRQLTQAALREDDPSALLKAVAGIGAMACTVAPDGTLDLGPFGARVELHEPAEVAQVLKRLRSRGLRAASSVETANGTLLVHPLGVRGRPNRYLVTGFAGRVSGLQRSTIAMAVTLLSLAEERKRAGRETDRRLRARALELLLAGDDRTAGLLLQVGPQPRPRLPRTPVVLRATGAVEAIEEGVELLESRLVLGAVLSGELVGVTTGASVAGLAAELAHLGFRVGIGEPTSLTTVARSFETAGHALELTSDQAPVLSWDAQVHRGVLSLIDSSRAAAFGDSFLDSLGEGSSGAVLVETLRSFLLHHGSQLKVAADLGIHRNTVRHRVAQIEDALGRSLGDPQTRVDAWVALTAARS